MISYVRTILAGQFEASLAMLNECIRRCPEAQWDGAVAKYPFWQVAYHTLYFVDLYLSPNEEAFQPREIHPAAGRDDIFYDPPIRHLGQPELTAYAAVCRRKAVDTLAAETVESLERASGFSWLPFTRGEVHIYNIRHIQHHAGQLGAYLRRVDPAFQHREAFRWVATGWES